jgi:SAM-dependent methyltransferase
MQPSEYDRMDRLETSMWWYRGLHQLVAGAVSRSAATAKSGLDAGCGTGGLLQVLQSEGGARWVGIEIDSHAASRARLKSRCAVASASIEAMPFAEAAFDVAVSADVLSHGRVEPERAVGELARVLRPGGTLILNLPAYRWLLSRHDQAVHNARRFTAGEVKALLQRHGFDAIAITYWNMLLFPAMVLARVWPSGDAAKSDVMEYPRWLDMVFSQALAIERVALRLGLRLPFGGSLLVTAQKK